MNNAYAGIGSRQTPKEIMTAMTGAAASLESIGWMLRSGAAYGADRAFERGVKNDMLKQIFIPWEGFNERRTTEDGVFCIIGSLQEQALKIAEHHHPAWERCSPAAKALHARNCFQVLGPVLNDPVRFVLAWTEGGRGGGGTGGALRLAQSLGIECIDLGKTPLQEAAERINEIVTSQGAEA